MNTKDKSNISEAKVKARLLEKGETVLEPFGDNERYDLAVDKGNGEIERIQVKTATLTDEGNAIKFNCRSTYYGADGVKSDTYSEDEIECFMVYSPEQGQVYKIPFKESPDREMTLRFRSEINDPKINYATEYEY